MLVECLLEALQRGVCQLLDPVVQVLHSCPELYLKAEALTVRKAIQVVLYHAQLFD